MGWTQRASQAVAVDRTIALSTVDAGRTVRVERLCEDSHDGCRLRESGVYEGTLIEVVTAGDPVVLSVFGNRLAVCRRCAEVVGVRVIDAA